MSRYLILLFVSIDSEDCDLGARDQSFSPFSEQETNIFEEYQVGFR